MKKLLQINPVLRVSTSTGRIMQEIGDLAMKNGWECYMAYSGGRDGKPDSRFHLLPVGNKWSVAWHGVITRLFDRHGLSSDRATRQFIHQIGEIKPNIIHIHNIHGYFLNYKLLFDYLLSIDVPIIWTVHDCWLYTGHCYYYSFAGCDKWKTGCGHCPQKKSFPTSIWLDRSAQNYKDKERAFTSISKDRLTIVPVSKWIGDEMKQSFLRNARFQVIHNGIDTDVFNIYDASMVKSMYGLEGKKIILGIASIWSEEKGLYDFYKLVPLLNEEEVIVLVGVSEELKKNLPKEIVGISRTENIHQLAELYAAAEAFVNPTWQDNYPTVNLESIACGTPVVTYRTGGSVESVTTDTGFIVEQGDLKGLIKAVRLIEQRGKEYYQQRCRDFALANFKKEDRYQEYVDLYESLINRNKGL